jgi:hypothetical protein
MSGRPQIVGKRKTRIQLSNGELMDLVVFVDEFGVEWMPLEATLYILKVNGISMTIFEKEE